MKERKVIETMLSVRVADSLIGRLRLESARRGVPMRALVATALEAALPAAKPRRTAQAKG